MAYCLYVYCQDYLTKDKEKEAEAAELAEKEAAEAAAAEAAEKDSSSPPST